jgi:hypothetical protein
VAKRNELLEEVLAGNPPANWLLFDTIDRKYYPPAIVARVEELTVAMLRGEVHRDTWKNFKHTARLIANMNVEREKRGEERIDEYFSTPAQFSPSYLVFFVFPSFMHVRKGVPKGYAQLEARLDAELLQAGLNQLTKPLPRTALRLYPRQAPQYGGVADSGIERQLVNYLLMEKIIRT